MTRREITETQPVPRCAKGHHSRHMVDLRRQSAGGGHYIECRCCQTRKMHSFDAAVREWATIHRLRKNSAPSESSRNQQKLF